MKQSNPLHVANKRIIALAHKLRLSIIKYLLKNPHSSVKSLYKALEIEQSVCSQHLRILRSAKIVSFCREGKSIKYSVREDLLNRIVNEINFTLKVTD